MACSMRRWSTLSAQQPHRRPCRAILQNYKPVTAERLKKPEDGDWLIGAAHLRRLGLQSARAADARQRRAAAAGVGVRDRRAKRPSGAADGEQRRDVRRDAGEPGDRARRENRRALWRYRRPLPDEVIQLHRTSRGRRAVRQQGVLRGGRSRARRSRRDDGQGSLDDEGRRKRERLLHVGRAPGRRRQGDGRCVRRRARRPRLRRRVRSRDRQAAVEGVYGARARRTGQRDLAAGRPVEDRRRFGVGHRQLRSGDQPRVLGHRQRRPVDGRSAPGRQPLYVVHDRDRCRDRRDQRPSPVPPERFVGLGRGVAADSRRLQAQRANHQGSDRRRARRVSVVPRASRTARSSSSKARRS